MHFENVVSIWLPLSFLLLHPHCSSIVFFFINIFEVFFPRGRGGNQKENSGIQKCFFLNLAVSRDTFSEFGLLPPATRVHSVSFFQRGEILI